MSKTVFFDCLNHISVISELFGLFFGWRVGASEPVPVPTTTQPINPCGLVKSRQSLVLALQHRLGLSYKDAAHRLYMAELERVKRDKMMFSAFSDLEKSTKKTLEMALTSLGEIEGPQK